MLALGETFGAFDSEAPRSLNSLEWPAILRIFDSVSQDEVIEVRRESTSDRRALEEKKKVLTRNEERK